MKYKKINKHDIEFLKLATINTLVNSKITLSKKDIKLLISYLNRLGLQVFPITLIDIILLKSMLFLTYVKN